MMARKIRVRATFRGCPAGQRTRIAAHMYIQLDCPHVRLHFAVARVKLESIITIIIIITIICMITVACVHSNGARAARNDYYYYAKAKHVSPKHVSSRRALRNFNAMHTRARSNTRMAPNRRVSARAHMWLMV